MVHKKAQFDDRIRNLLALAEDNSVESRTLLFSHICDLFLQERPMESDNQVRMLIEIINELISDVDIGIRIELRNILLTTIHPPAPLIKLISEDVIEVSAKLLEDALIEEEQLLYLIKYGSNNHREYISHRFGLSPLLRRELDNARKEAEKIKAEVTLLAEEAEHNKISLQELEEAEQNSTDLNEDVTANILEVLRASKNNKSADIAVIHADKDQSVETADEHKNETSEQPLSLTSKIIQFRELEEDQIDAPLEDTVTTVPEPTLDEETSFDEETLFEDEPASEEVIAVEINLSVAPEPSTEEPLFHSGAAAITDEWFWEIDRYGNIKYLSENAESVFLQTPSALAGEDFLCLWLRKGETENDPNDFIALFEKRQPFRNEDFIFEISPNVFQGYLLSAIATFDIDTGRFTGFRGSAQLNEVEFEQTTPNQPEVKTEEQELILTSPLDEGESLDQVHLEEENLRPQFSDDINDDVDENQEKNAPAPLLEEPTIIPADDEVASEMLHNLSHEFRTPLNAIIGFSQMIDNEMWGPISDKYRKNTKDIINAANHLKEAVNNILDSAKIDAGLIEPSPESFSLKSVIQDAMRAIAPIIESKEIRVTGIDDNIDVILFNDKHCIILCLIKIITFATKHADMLLPLKDNKLLRLKLM
ncbi:MAG: hypothetical protein HOH18_08735 [Kordiimonadaceae bacterium]|nr:hypothetical protein [Kordiimonadaceae bacterium]